MEWYWILLLMLMAGLLGAAASLLVPRWWPQRFRAEGRKLIRPMLESHFAPVALEELIISERKFPHRVRVDLQRALEHLFGTQATVLHFSGVRKEYTEAIQFATLMVDGHSPAVSVPPEYDEVDIGEDQPCRCLKLGLWLLKTSTTRYAVLMAPSTRYGEPTGVQFQIATINDSAGAAVSQEFFHHLEAAITQAKSYRGKVLSLEKAEHAYSGESTGIMVHTLKPIEREQVILPEKTLDLLERNVIQFVRQRPALARLRMPTRKGLLFYGPPGTGKTLTIHYLARALPDHTTLLISAEQVGLLDEYMTLARLLQPSLVVLEDVDLIARDRENMNSPCEEVLLNKLLNEMDGLREEADILFLLTTNRPEALETALASRPGRIDQAIEFPLPDEPGREKLVRLYASGLTLADDVVCFLVERTERVSAAFIKELMRRSVQFHLERNGTGHLEVQDVDRALDEMLFAGGSLNLKLLGAERSVHACSVNGD